MSRNIDIPKIEEMLAQYPIYQYGFLKSEEVEYTEKVRMVCKIECGRYGKSWSCPPAVGTVDECRERCLKYPYALFFSTVNHVVDSMNFTELLATKAEHEVITAEVEKHLKDAGYEIYRMSGESCSVCKECTCPDALCRFPEKMHPCIESHGIVVAKLTDDLEMDYYIDEHEQLWFTLIYFK